MSEQPDQETINSEVNDTDPKPAIVQPTIPVTSINSRVPTLSKFYHILKANKLVQAIAFMGINVLILYSALLSAFFIFFFIHGLEGQTWEQQRPEWVVFALTYTGVLWLILKSRKVKNIWLIVLTCAAPVASLIFMRLRDSYSSSLQLKALLSIGCIGAVCYFILNRNLTKNFVSYLAVITATLLSITTIYVWAVISSRSYNAFLQQNVAVRKDTKNQPTVDNQSTTAERRSLEVQIATHILQETSFYTGSNPISFSITQGGTNSEGQTTLYDAMTTEFVTSFGNITVDQYAYQDKRKIRTQPCFETGMGRTPTLYMPPMCNKSSKSGFTFGGYPVLHTEASIDQQGRQVNTYYATDGLVSLKFTAPEKNGTHDPAIQDFLNSFHKITQEDIATLTTLPFQLYK